MAMESFSFQNLGYRPLKELGPGEIVIVNQEGIKTLMAPGSKMRIAHSCGCTMVIHPVPTRESVLSRCVITAGKIWQNVTM